MDIQTRKLALIRDFLNIHSEKVVARLEEILLQEAKITNNQNLKPMGIDEFNEQINEAIEDSKQNRYSTATDLKKKIQKWT